MARRSVFFSLTLCFALLLPISLATQTSQQQHHQTACQLNNLQSLKPSDRVQSEAGLSEFWDVDENQLDCAGVAPARHTIQPKGLLLPSYSNSPRLIYIIQGSGVGGVVIPGCPETFQAGTRREGDEHQRLHSIHQGDIFAIPDGLSIWAYNDGDQPLIAVSILDISNDANQLDRTPRRFFLAGSQSEGHHHRRGSSDSYKNIFNGFDTELLVEALGVSMETVKKIQNVNDKRGFIVKVDSLEMIRPRMEQERRRGSVDGNSENGMEDLFCKLQVVRNIDNPSLVDIYSRDGGHLTNLNGVKLSALQYIRLSAEKGYLRRGSMLAPHYNINSHSIVYAVRGSARVQIVDHTGRSVFDGRIKEGEIIVVPQNYAVVKQADEENEFEWIAFKTSQNAMTTSLAGKTSILRGLPEDVLVNSYGISREEARTLKHGRELETSILRPISLSARM